MQATKFFISHSSTELENEGFRKKNWKHEIISLVMDNYELKVRNIKAKRSPLGFPNYRHSNGGNEKQHFFNPKLFLPLTLCQLRQ